MVVLIHRGWSVERFRHQLSFILNISGARISCWDGPFKMKDRDDLESLWMGRICSVVIDDSTARFPCQSVNQIECEKRLSTVNLLFSYGGKWINLRLQPNWTFAEVYWVLFINGIISNPQAEGWNFYKDGKNMKVKLDDEIKEWRKAKSGAIMVVQAMKGGGWRKEMLRQLRAMAEEPE
jgi:hypothetical protein